MLDRERAAAGVPRLFAFYKVTARKLAPALVSIRLHLLMNHWCVFLAPTSAPLLASSVALLTLPAETTHLPAPLFVDISNAVPILAPSNGDLTGSFS